MYSFSTLPSLFRPLLLILDNYPDFYFLYVFIKHGFEVSANFKLSAVGRVHCALPVCVSIYCPTTSVVLTEG